MTRARRHWIVLCCTVVLLSLGFAAPRSWGPAALPAAAQTLKPTGGGVTAAAFSPDGKYLVVGYGDSQLVQWDSPAGQLRDSVSAHLGSAVSGVVFSPDGKTVVSAGRDSRVRQWDAGNYQLQRTLQGHEHPLESVAVSPDGGTLASGGQDTRIALWDGASGRLRRILAGHKDFVTAVAFSPDGKTLASGAQDGQLILWDASGGQRRAVVFGHAGGVERRPLQSGRRVPDQRREGRGGAPVGGCLRPPAQHAAGARRAGPGHRP